MGEEGEMTSRERLKAAIEHRPVDKIPLDLGSTPVTGISALSLSKLRKALGLEERPVKVHEPYQILGWMDEDVLEALEVDVVGIWLPGTLLGFRNTGRWKPWRYYDGTELLISEEAYFTEDDAGNLYSHPEGPGSRASAKLPKDGFYFDALIYQEPVVHLDPEDFVEQTYPLLSEDDLRAVESQAKDLYEDTDYGLIGNFGGAGLGDIAIVPGPFLDRPRGIRDPEGWYMALVLHRDYIREIFELQTERAIRNLELYRQAVGDRIQVIFLSGTDFGGQEGLLVSPDLFRELWKPFYRRINDWVHRNTSWKTFYHSCGSVVELLDDFVDMGVDILNPVQISARGMDPKFLKERYGDKLTFWGGGVDTQRTLPFGSPEDVEREVRENTEIFGRGSGFVFNTVHNVQANVPVENLLAMFRAFDEVREVERWRRP